MSGLDKFMKVPSKSPKKPTTKEKKNPEKQKPPPKQTIKQEPKESREDNPSDDSNSLPLEKDQSEEITESPELSPETSIIEEDLEVNQEPPSHSRKFTKFQLKCTSKKCNYQRILMKSVLSSSDSFCPKCGSQMRQKQLGQ